MGSPEVRTRYAGRAGRASVGVAEVGLAAILVALAALASTGEGLPRTTLAVAEPLTWVADAQRGQLTQVDPLTGRVEARIRAGRPGEMLEVAQEGGRLVVTNHATGGTLMLDSGTLAVTGQRPARSGGVRVLLADARTYVVELDRGVVRRVDAATMSDAGRPLETGRPITDAVAGTDGALWLLMRDGAVDSYNWSARSGQFERAEPAGVAALGDVDRSVVVVASRERVAEIAVGEIGCTEPWRPTIFQGLIYVPCREGGRVVVLTVGGQRAAPDIALPGSPQPVRHHHGLLLAAGQQAVFVSATGDAARALQLNDPGVAVRDLGLVR